MMHHQVAKCYNMLLESCEAILRRFLRISAVKLCEIG